MLEISRYGTLRTWAKSWATLMRLPFFRRHLMKKKPPTKP
jgi:ferritin-like metal-binding protein YciE